MVFSNFFLYFVYLDLRFVASFLHHKLFLIFPFLHFFFSYQLHIHLLVSNHFHYFSFFQFFLCFVVFPRFLFLILLLLYYLIQSFLSPQLPFLFLLSLLSLLFLSI